MKRSPDYSTRAEDGHVWHESVDGQPLDRQVNAKFAHRLDWWPLCGFCCDQIVDVGLAWAQTRYPLSDAVPHPLAWVVAA